MFSSRAPRFNVQFTAVYDDGTRYLTAPVTNLSDSGLFIETTAPVVAGTKVRIIPLLPPSRGLPEFDAEVVRIQDTKEELGKAKPAGMGLRFVELEDSALALVQAFCDGMQGATGLEKPVAGGEPLPGASKDAAKATATGGAPSSSESSGSAKSSSAKSGSTKSATAKSGAEKSAKGKHSKSGKTGSHTFANQATKPASKSVERSKLPKTDLTHDDLPLLEDSDSQLLDVADAEIQAQTDERLLPDAPLTEETSVKSRPSQGPNPVTAKSKKNESVTDEAADDFVQSERSFSELSTAEDELPSMGAGGFGASLEFAALSGLGPKNGLLLGLVALQLVAVLVTCGYLAYRFDVLGEEGKAQNQALANLNQELADAKTRQHGLTAALAGQTDRLTALTDLANQPLELAATLRAEPAGPAGRTAVFLAASVENPAPHEAKVVYTRHKLFAGSLAKVAAATEQAQVINRPGTKGPMIWRLVEERVTLGQAAPLKSIKGLSKKDRAHLKKLAAAAPTGASRTHPTAHTPLPAGSIAAGAGSAGHRNVIVDLPTGGVLMSVTEAGIVTTDDDATSGRVVRTWAQTAIAGPAQ